MKKYNIFKVIGGFMVIISAVISSSASAFLLYQSKEPKSLKR